MGKNDAFAVGSLVFARVKGYAPWPARITKADKKKYSVYFFGTGEVSTSLKPEDLFDYVDNKAKFVIDKNLKRKFYKEAVDQIENALKGDEDISAINDASPPSDDLTAIEGHDTTTETTTLPAAENLSETEELPESTKKAAAAAAPQSPPPPTAASKPDAKSSPAGTASVVTPQPTAKKADAQTNNAVEQPAVVETAPSPEPEIVSRSGRKIKPKRYLDAETEDILPSPKQRKMTIDSPKESPIISKNVEHFLKLESKLMELDHLIKSSVGLNGAQPEECIKHLNEYKELDITPLMLKKHPSCVETMKRLRRYVGNVKAWEMNDALKQDFDTKAQQIRQRAEDIYTGYKKMFNFQSEAQQFWDFFQTIIEDFRKKTEHLTDEQVAELIEEPQSEEKADIQA